MKSMNGRLYEMMMNGRIQTYGGVSISKVKEMMMPVKCNRCNQIYDLCGEMKVIHRYADCTLYQTPCCHQNVDDREYITNPAFTRIDKDKL